MTCRGVRGGNEAVVANTASEINAATRELLTAIVVANGIAPEDVASVIFTATADLDAAYPAVVARGVGLGASAIVVHAGDARHGQFAAMYPRAVALEHRQGTPGGHRARLSPRSGEAATGSGAKSGPQGRTMMPAWRGRSCSGRSCNGGCRDDVWRSRAWQGLLRGGSPAILWGRWRRWPAQRSRRCFPRVESGRAAYAMLPVENAVAGAVAGAYELLWSGICASMQRSSCGFAICSLQCREQRSRGAPGEVPPAGLGAVPALSWPLWPAG